MSAAVLLLDRSRFTPADERLMRAVAWQLAPQGLTVQRGPEGRDDRYDLFSCFSAGVAWASAAAVVPAWTVLRRPNGRYQLQDGFGEVLAVGRRLAEVLPPEWRPLRLVP